MEEVTKTAIKMLEENLDLRLISQVTGLNIEEIQKLKNWKGSLRK